MSTLESKSVRRREDQRLLIGGGNYAADDRRSDMLHAILVRSPHAHAQITAIDVAAARGMPGIAAVYTADDLTDVKPIPGGIGFPRPDGGPSAKTDRPLLVCDRVRFVGEPVVLVVAESRAAGLEAAEAVMIDYSGLPLVTDPIAAMEPGARACRGPSGWPLWRTAQVARSGKPTRARAACFTAWSPRTNCIGRPAIASYSRGKSPAGCICTRWPWKAAQPLC